MSSLSPVNNAKISVWVKAQDKAGNWMDSPTSVQLDGNLNANGTTANYFTFDESLPEAGVTVPGAYVQARSTDVLKGIASDSGRIKGVGSECH